MTLEQKYEALLEDLRQGGPIAIAFSAGVDSTLLLAAAKAALGEDVLALTAVTAAIPRRELGDAEKLAESLGARHIALGIDALAVPGFRTNAPDRCYHCKKHIFETLLAAAGAEGFSRLAEGSNLDDEGDYRPGHRALQELGIESPLRAAGLTKAEIRALSKRLGLPTAEKPSFACLASRVPYGEAITAEKLRRIDDAEQLLFERGYPQFRVRSHGDLARIEVPEAELARLLAERKAITAALRALGFTYVTMDLEGFESGKLNRDITKTEA